MHKERYERIVLLFSILFVLLTLNFALEICPIDKYPSSMEIVHLRDRANNKIQVTISLKGNTPSGEIPLAYQNITVMGSVFTYSIPPAIYQTDKEGFVKFNISTCGSDSVIPNKCIDPSTVSYNITAIYEGGKAFYGSMKNVGYRPIATSIINPIACLPFILLLGLLMAAMYASGRDPFAYFDFSRFIFRPPRAERGVKGMTIAALIPGMEKLKSSIKKKQLKEEKKRLEEKKKRLEEKRAKTPAPAKLPKALTVVKEKALTVARYGKEAVKGYVGIVNLIIKAPSKLLKEEVKLARQGLEKLKYPITPYKPIREAAAKGTGNLMEAWRSLAMQITSLRRLTEDEKKSMKNQLSLLNSLSATGIAYLGGRMHSISSQIWFRSPDRVKKEISEVFEQLRREQEIRELQTEIKELKEKIKFIDRTNGIKEALSEGPGRIKSFISAHGKDPHDPIIIPSLINSIITDSGKLADRKKVEALGELIKIYEKDIIATINDINNSKRELKSVQYLLNDYKNELKRNDEFISNWPKIKDTIEKDLREHYLPFIDLSKIPTDPEKRRELLDFIEKRQESIVAEKGIVEGHEMLEGYSRLSDAIEKGFSNMDNYVKDLRLDVNSDLNLKIRDLENKIQEEVYNINNKHGKTFALYGLFPLESAESVENTIFALDTARLSLGFAAEILVQTEDFVNATKVKEADFTIKDIRDNVLPFFFESHPEVPRNPDTAKENLTKLEKDIEKLTAEKESPVTTPKDREKIEEEINKKRKEADVLHEYLDIYNKMYNAEKELMEIKEKIGGNKVNEYIEKTPAQINIDYQTNITNITKFIENPPDVGKVDEYLQYPYIALALRDIAQPYLSFEVFSSDPSATKKFFEEHPEYLKELEEVSKPIQEVIQMIMSKPTVRIELEKGHEIGGVA